MFDLSIKCGYDSVPVEWQSGNDPGEGATTRNVTKFSANIFIMQLTKWLKDENVDILFDTVVSQPIMEKGRCTAVIVENKTGTQCYEADIVIDATGDADVLYRAGVPTVQGKNYHTFYTRITSLEDCANAIKEKDIKLIYKRMVYGGTANLFGEGQPENKPLWMGTTAQDVTNYVVENHLEVLEKIANDNRKERDISELPYMPQFRKL